jgi:hypothetical protein
MIAAAILLEILAGYAAAGEVPNLALSAQGARARSWRPDAVVLAGHEPGKANDGSFRSYWLASPESLPADLGLEWPEPRKLSSVIVRYVDGRMARGPVVARTQSWARLQYWEAGAWKDLDAEVVWHETASARYSFSPVTSTRLRLLFTEPPDPEFRRSPERLGIAVAELEAYREAPFHLVATPPTLVAARPRGTSYNEPPTGDSPFDIAGPLILEPKQTRVFSDRLEPTLIVAESRWARQPCVVERKGQEVRLRNGFLEVSISGSGTFRETRIANLVTGEAVPASESQAFLIRTSEHKYGPAEFQVKALDTGRSNEQICRVRIDLTSANWDVSVHYELRRQDHFFHKWLTLTNKTASTALVQDVTVADLGLPDPLDLMAGQELTYPVSRLKQGGFFSCLETIYWDHRGDALTYYPGAEVAPSRSLETVKAVVGVYRNTGERWLGWDRGVREWVIEYHAQVSPIGEQWPDVYTEAWSGDVGLKLFQEQPAVMERFLGNAQKLGVRFMDLLEPIHQAFDAPAGDIQRLMDLAGRFGLRPGFWIDFGSNRVALPHICKLSRESEAYFQKILEMTGRYKPGAMHWGDFLAVYPCNEAGHGHLPGKYSIHAQGQRIIELARQLREASPGLMLGADGGFTNPQYVRLEDSRAHGTFFGGYAGDHWPTVAPDIHLARLYAEMNRVWVYGSHAVFLRPWFRNLNMVNHFGKDSRNHDRAGFRYNLLSALAMAPQVTVDVSLNVPESEFPFARRWLEWARANKDYFKQGYKLFDRSHHFMDTWQSDADALSGFAHIRGDRGYVFLMNPSPVAQVAELDIALDTPPSTQLVVEEVFPGGMALRGPAGGFYAQGGKLRITVPGKQVRIVWIVPASESKRLPDQPEDVRVAGSDRYVGAWTATRSNAESATLRSQFRYPADAGRYLSDSAPESEWSAEPWAHDKAYLVLLLKDESRELINHWVPEKAGLVRRNDGRDGSEPIAVSINGSSRKVHAFLTRRNQMKGLTRCYFLDLGTETKPGETNSVEVTLPVVTGLVFMGAYLDLPDQMDVEKKP